jgi:hypothetical protein
MRVVEVTKIDWEPERKRQPVEPQTDEITDSIRLVDSETGKTVAIQYLLGENLIHEQRWLSRWFRFKASWHGMNSKNGSVRLSGIMVAHRTFGFAAPAPLRRRFSAGPTAFLKEHRDVSAILDQFAQFNWNLLTELEPEIAAEHERLFAEKILPDWRMAGTPWTSGIINNTAALPYHKDGGNVRGSWSAMLALRKDVDGGHLHLPEYGVTLGIPNGSVTIFDGQGVWHGVTPLIYKKKDAYRYTVVWYAKNGFASCGPASEELANGQKRATRESADDKA